MSISSVKYKQLEKPQEKIKNKEYTWKRWLVQCFSSDKKNISQKHERVLFFPKITFSFPRQND